MVGEESLVGLEAWEDVANPCEHFNKFVKVFAKLARDLLGKINTVQHKADSGTWVTYME